MTPNKTQLLSDWNKIKIKLHSSTKPPDFHEGEIWWVHVGENVGSELCGKGDKFSRPVLIFRKLNSEMFIGIPLTTKHKTGPWYFSFRFQNKTSTASLINTREFSALRLMNSQPLGNINRIDLVRARSAYHKLIFGY